MSKELDKIKERLGRDKELNRNKGIERNKMLMDFNLVSSGNPAETNRTILKAIVVVCILLAAYLVSFYV